MRQFVLGQTAVVSSSGTAIDTLQKGAVSLFDLSSGAPKPSYFASSVVTNAIKKHGLIAVGTDKGTITIPIHANKFSWVKGSYVAAKTFTQNITVVSRGCVGDYTVIVAKKGQPCNERYKWTATYHVFDPDMTAEAIAAKLGQEMKNSCAGAGVKVSIATNVITVTGINAGDDYSIVLADLANFSTLGTATVGTKALFDAEAIKDMYMKAAADAGIEYTYLDGASLIYPTYPLKQDAATSTGYIVYTLKFAEPREVGTVDEVVNQVVQIAFPSGTSVTDWEKVLGAIG